MGVDATQQPDRVRLRVEAQLRVVVAEAVVAQPRFRVLVLAGEAKAELGGGGGGRGASPLAPDVEAGFPGDGAGAGVGDARGADLVRLQQQVPGAAQDGGGAKLPGSKTYSRGAVRGCTPQMVAAYAVYRSGITSLKPGVGPRPRGPADRASRGATSPLP